jgi:hypothetical protein
MSSQTDSLRCKDVRFGIEMESTIRFVNRMSPWTVSMDCSRLSSCVPVMTAEDMVMDPTVFALWLATKLLISLTVAVCKGTQ